MRTTQSMAQGARSAVEVITLPLSAGAHPAFSRPTGRVRQPSRMTSVSWLFIALLAAAVAVLVGAEWPRLSHRLGTPARERRRRARRKAALRIVPSESEEFAASVQRDLDRLPTIEERDPKR